MAFMLGLYFAYSFVLWILYIVLNKVYTLFRNVKWRYDRTYWQHQDPYSYDRCVHVMNVIWKHRLDPWTSGRERDFILTHNRFENSDFILRDDVSLYDVNEIHAVFLQAKSDWPKPVFQEDFYILGQFHSAENVITMPLKYFNKFAEDLKDDGAKIIFIQNQARCGGTLLTSIFKETEQCVCFNEPHCINAVCYNIYSKHLWHAEDAKRMFKNTVRVLCKPYHGFNKPVLAYVIKPTAPSIVCTELAQESFPDCIQLFMYRDPLAICQSLRRAGEALVSFHFFYHLPNIPNISSFMMHATGYVDVDFRGWTCAIHQELEFGYRAACITMYHYLKALKHGVNIKGLRYIHLVKERKKMTKLIFEACSLPSEIVAEATEAFKKDSQKVSPVSRDKLNALMPDPTKITPEFLEVARQLAKTYGVPGPDVWEDKSFHLENSLIP